MVRKYALNKVCTSINTRDHAYLCTCDYQVFANQARQGHQRSASAGCSFKIDQVNKYLVRYRWQPETNVGNSKDSLATFLPEMWPSCLQRPRSCDLISNTTIQCFLRSCCLQLLSFNRLKFTSKRRRQH